MPKPKFSKKTYEMVAEVLKRHGCNFDKSEIQEIATEFSETFKSDNPRFKPEFFMRACGL